MEDIVIPIVAIISIFVLSPIAVAFARLMWKRGSDGSARRPLETDLMHRRLEHLQQSMEAMALEVERISEGQRFVTRLLSDKERQSIVSGTPPRVP